MGKFLPTLLASSIAAFSASVAAEITLEEVIVTAQRKSESLQDAAIPISVATGKDLVLSGVTDASGLNNVAPALQINKGGGPNISYFIRGVGNFTSNGYTDPAVAFNDDGVYVGRPTGSSFSFLDVERVEILKGPQGTLYGRNATGGAINVIPVKPQLGENSANATIGFGNEGAIEFNAALNFAISENTAARISLGKLENDGYNDDGTNQTDDILVRGQVFSEVSDSFDARLSVSYAEVKGKGVAATLLGNYDFSPFTPASETAPVNYTFVEAPENVSRPGGGYFTDETQAYLSSLDENGDPIFSAAPGWLRPDGNDPIFQDHSYLNVTGEFNIGTSIGDLVIIPAYRKAELFGSQLGPGFKGGPVDEEAEQSSFEARLSSSAGKLDWLLGAYYFDETVDGRTSFAQFMLSSVQEYVVDTKSYAAFARGTLNITDSFRLVAGLRYTEDEKTMDGTAYTALALCTLPTPPFGPGCIDTPSIPAELGIEATLAAIDPSQLPIGAPGIGTGPVPYGTGSLLLVNQTLVVDSLDESETTYRVSVEYDLTPDSLLYAGFESGYRSGGFALALSKEVFEPEYIDAYTIGSKNRFMDNRLQLNAEAYYWDYTDQQVAHPGIDPNGGTIFFTENVGDSTIYGLDVDVLFQATETTLLKANVQYLKNELDEFVFETPDNAANAPGSPIPPGFVTPVNGCTNTPGTDEATGLYNFSIDCSGKPGYQSPEWAINAGVEQLVDVSDGFDLVINLDVRYRDEFYAGAEYLPHQLQDSTTTADLSLTLMADDEVWFVTLYGRNITDEDDTSTNRFFFPSLGNLATATYSTGVTYGVRAGMEF